MGGEREGAGSRGERWPKQCMQIWINEKQKNLKKNGGGRTDKRG
jgi:hypothetical protein